MSYACDKCAKEALWVQAKYRGNSDDRHGPTVLYRCTDHIDQRLRADPMPVPFLERSRE